MTIRLATAVLFALIAAACLPLAARGEFPSPEAHYTFDSEHVEADSLRPQTGSLAGKIVGGAVVTKDQPPALNLTGKQHVTLTDDITSATLPTKALSVAAWVRLDKAAEWGGIVSCIQDNGSYERGWLLGFRGARFCFAVASETTKKLTYLMAPANAALGQWYHVVGTYDGTTMVLYVDGQAVARSDAQRGSILYPPRTWLELGCYRDDNERYPMTGRLAEVAWYAETLSAEVVSRQFEATHARFPGSKAEAVDVAHWPTYMRDYARSGHTAQRLELPLALHWIYHARHAPQPAWPLPARHNFWHNKYNLKARVTYDRAFHLVSDGEGIYFGSSADDAVRRLDLATGKEAWKFFTEGPVRLAPSLSDGKVFFGSDDGCVYCVSSKDGSLVWKQPIAEQIRRIPGSQRIISAWPVRTDALTQDGQVRCAAGLFPAQGIFQAALATGSGKVLARGAVNFSPQGYLRMSGGALMISQGRAPDTVFDKLARRGKTTTTQAAAVGDEFPFAHIATANLRIGGGDGKVAAFAIEDGKQVWSAEVEGKAYSLAVAGGRLLVSTDRGVVYCFGAEKKQPARGHVHQAETAAFAYDDAKTEQAHSRRAEQLLHTAGCTTGYALLLGGQSGQLAFQLVQQSDLHVVVVEPDVNRADAAREALSAAGVYGPRVCVHQGPVEQLPYADNLFNAVFVPHRAMKSVKPAEIERLLSPRGVAVVSTKSDLIGEMEAWQEAGASSQWKAQGNDFVFQKLPIEGGGSWTHIYADPANTVCSGDRHAQSEFALQWFGPPGPRELIDRHHRTVPPLYCHGRLFVVGDNRVYGVDAYNGTMLWDVEIPGSRRVAAMRDCGSMVATEDKFYVAAQEKCCVIDAANGRRLSQFAPPAAKDGRRGHWGYVARVGDRLFGSRTRPGASRSGHSRQQIGETYWDHIPLVTSNALFCVDRQSGENRWVYEPTGGAIINPTITIGEQRVFFVESGDAETLKAADGRSKLSQLVGQGAHLVALDAASGKEIFRAAAGLEKLEHHVFLCYAQGKVIAVGSRNHRDNPKARPTVWYDTHAYDAATGKPIWKTTQNNRQGAGGDHGEQDHHPVIVGDRLYVEPLAYNLHDGKRIEGWNLRRGGHGCGTVSASAGACYFRAGNPTVCDLDSGKLNKLTRVTRPGCWINIIPAGGLLLIPEASSGCTCNFAVQASLALSPVARSER